jgi:hypothetical protein
MSFITSFKTAQQKFLRPLLYILVCAVAIYPLVPYPTYKYIALFVLATAIIRFIQEIETNFNQKVSSIEDRIKVIQSDVQGPNPPNWDNYTAAQNIILTDIYASFERGDDVKIDIIGVSARYSWRMAEDQLGPIIKKFDRRKLTVNVAVCTEEILLRWNLTSWREDMKRTIQGIKDFSSIHHEAVESGNLNINHFEFDTLPQWHGVMINEKTLYMGRTEWIFYADSPPAMKVGQCQYRKFEPSDRFGGEPRIKMFSNWMERLKKRSEEIRGE